jgi:uncharacterized iron-regulated protein
MIACTDFPRLGLDFCAALSRWRVLLVPTALLAALVGCATPTPLATDAHTQQARLDAALASKPLVLLGEVHDNQIQHHMRVQALSRLLKVGKRPALLMEQFDRERQPALDAAIRAPGATARTLIEAAGGKGWNWPFYEPFIDLALQHQLPIIAANVSRADASRVMRDGLAALALERPVGQQLLAQHTQIIDRAHCNALPAGLAAKMAQAQLARDIVMAQLLVEHHATGAVLLAGNGHVRNDIGAPHWLPDGLRTRAVAIGLLESDADAAAFDVAIVTAAQLRPDPCIAFRQQLPGTPR